ncbi:hypothetical protein [Chelativorans sp. YIM 93263]|uniref:hypothetical protein n=1 Tax=Chelativorans sp. YIM 93263 TaxID=2906648 RepID=UPI002378FADD|nr:hypothetical protein [Chelativorans sp. YIM 93263]
MRKTMMGGAGLAALAAGVLFIGAQQATSENNVCAPREDLVAQLDAQFAERQKAVGLLGEQAVMEVYASDQGSWTILSTDTDGTSCIIAAGEGWDDTFTTQVGQGV